MPIDSPALHFLLTQHLTFAGCVGQSFSSKAIVPPCDVQSLKGAYVTFFNFFHIAYNLKTSVKKLLAVLRP